MLGSGTEPGSSRRVASSLGHGTTSSAFPFPIKTLTVENTNKNSNKYHITHTQEALDGWKMGAKVLVSGAFPRVFV